MSRREPTVQQLFPLGAMKGRPLSLLAAVVAPAFAVFMSRRNEAEIDSPIVVFGSLVLAAAAGLMIVFFSSPLRAPFSYRSALVVLSLALASMVVGAVAMWESNAALRNDWGPTVVGTMILALAPYRRPRELVVFGIFSAILAGFVALLQARQLDDPRSSILLVVIAVSPILVISLGAAGFVRAIIDEIQSWRRQSSAVAIAIDGEENDWIARSVQKERVAILNRDVVPFFTSILREDRIGVDDVNRAREISRAIRAVMLADVERTWLDILVETALASRDPFSVDPPLAVFDDLKLADRMSIEQRASCRAFVNALFSLRGIDPRSFSISLAPDHLAVGVAIEASIDSADAQVRPELAPYLAVMRVLFMNLSVEFARPALTLRFSYDE